MVVEIWDGAYWVGVCLDIFTLPLHRSRHFWVCILKFVPVKNEIPSLTSNKGSNLNYILYLIYKITNLIFNEKIHNK
jgi:hypothetical protein